MIIVEVPASFFLFPAAVVVAVVVAGVAVVAVAVADAAVSAAAVAFPAVFFVVAVFEADAVAVVVSVAGGYVLVAVFAVFAVGVAVVAATVVVAGAPVAAFVAAGAVAGVYAPDHAAAVVGAGLEFHRAVVSGVPLPAGAAVPASRPWSLVAEEWCRVSQPLERLVPWGSLWRECLGGIHPAGAEQTAGSPTSHNRVRQWAVCNPRAVWLQAVPALVDQEPRPVQVPAWSGGRAGTAPVGAGRLIAPHPAAPGARPPV